MLVTLAVTAIVAVLTGWWLPRGPVTTFAAVMAVVLAAVLGVAAGRFTGSRWSLLLTPAVFMVFFELARLRADGPRVDAIRFDGIYGVIMFIAGRGVDAVLILLPMLVGIGFGVVAARRAAGAVPKRRWPGRVLLGLGTIAVLVLVAALLRPASTE